jgi:hypothetical protein
MYRSLSLLLTLALMGCPSADKSSGIDSAGGGGAADFAPQEGTWAAGEIVYDDACGLGMEDDSEDVPNSIILEMDADGGGFTISEEEDDEPMICTLDGQSFTCEVSEDDEFEEDFAEADLDAVVRFDQTIGGDFSSETQGELRMVFDVTCEGEDCADVAEMMELDIPCTSLMSMPLTAL